MELLKDKPEFKETIENNIFLLKDLEDIIEDIEVEVSFDDDKDDIVSDIVECINENLLQITIGKEIVGEAIEDKQILALAIYEVLDEYSPAVEVENRKQIALDIIDKMSEFVKENYGISIKEAYLLSANML